MRTEIIINNRRYSADIGSPLDISIPLLFNGEQPNIYDAEKAASKACEIGSFTGDTRRGGGCNFEEYTMIPHCNGTHTECAGHITDERIAVNSILKDALIPCQLITVKPANARETDDTYRPEKKPEDSIITEKEIQAGLKNGNSDFTMGLVIRTLPNDSTKKSRRYTKKAPPFFSVEAIGYINELGVKHLLVDIPSVDRTYDEGRLTVHHLFWNIEEGKHEMSEENLSYKTITEMVYIPDGIADGEYLLNLQIAPFTSDAAPSRPLLFGITAAVK